MRDLKEYELFKKFSNLTLAKLANIVKEKEYQEDDIIFREGDQGNALYIVAEGEIAIRRFIDKYSGKHKTIAIMEKGDFFGEMAIFDDKPRSASAFVSRKAKVIEIKKDDFMKLIYGEPTTAITNLLAMNKVMSERLRITNQNFITTYEVGRIMATVMNLNDLFDLVLEQLSSAVEKSDASFCAYYDEFSGDFRIVARKGEEAEKINEAELAKDDSIIKDIVQNLKSIYIENTDDSKKYPDLANRTYDGKSLIASPVVRQDKLMAIIFVVSFKEYGAFNQSNKLLIGTVSSQIAPVIENLKIREEEENKKRLEQKKHQF